jgi:hypothetical protein
LRADNGLAALAVTPMTTHPIPAAALDDRLGFLEMTESGKTFGA